MGEQARPQGGPAYSAPQASHPYQPTYSNQQAPMQTGPTTGGPGIGLGGQMNHMVQPDTIMPMALPYQPTAELKPNAGPSSFTPMPTMANDPLSQFGDKPPITASPQQLAPQQGFMSPLMQQQMMRQRSMFNPMQQGSGLQAALMQMLSRQNQPMMRPQMRQMPQYRSPALGFRPNMTQAQQSLNRVQPSVYKTDLDTARARIAELEAAQQPQQDPYYGGGG